MPNTKETKTTPSTPPTDGGKELADIVASQAETIAELKSQIEVLTGMLTADADVEEKKKLPGEFDPDKPFQKHRGTFGIVLEQEGKHFNLKGEKIKKKKVG